MTEPKNFPFLTFLLSFTLAAGLVAGCGRIQTGGPEATAEVTIDLAIDPAEPAVGNGQLAITVTDPAGQPIDNAILEIEGNMSHAGMVPVLAETTTGPDGRAVVPFEWTMGGDWLVTVQATLPDGQTAAQAFPVTVR